MGDHVQRPPREPPSREPARESPARESLTRDRVLRAGVDLADAEGLDAVTMRGLAGRLDVVATALYKHIADKEDLLDGMVDTLVDEMATPRTHPTTQWQSAIRDTVHNARRVVTEHEWARRALESRTVRTAAVLHHMERVSEIFLDAGFSADLTHHVMHLLGNRIWGFSPELFTGPPGSPSAGTPRRSTGPVPDPDDYPAIVAITVDSRARRPQATGCDEDFEFDFALDVLIDGIARLRDMDWSSPT
ncbi:TetR/AcrR family transcriptional regulator [Gordonia sp. NPDC003376]